MQKMLSKGEKIMAITLQPRMLPGSCFVTPNIIYATNRRIIIVDPHVPDFKGGKVSIPYNTMTSLKLEEGPYSTLAIKFESPSLINTMGLGKIHGIVGGKNRNERIIDAIPRTKAEELINVMLFGMHSDGIKSRSNSLGGLEVRRINHNAHGGKSSTLDIYESRIRSTSKSSELT
jgi:hypothetical protein